MKFRHVYSWLVVLRIYVALAIFQPYRDLETGDNLHYIMQFYSILFSILFYYILYSILFYLANIIFYVI